MLDLFTASHHFLIMSATVEIYTRFACPYCYRAKLLLEEKGAEFVEIDANGDKRVESIERSGGRTSVPQIFIDGFHVGGCDDLYALDRAGKLVSLLNGDKVS